MGWSIRLSLLDKSTKGGKEVLDNLDTVSLVQGSKELEELRWFMPGDRCMNYIHDRFWGHYQQFSDGRTLEVEEFVKQLDTDWEYLKDGKIPPDLKPCFMTCLPGTNESVFQRMNEDGADDYEFSYNAIKTVLKHTAIKPENQLILMDDW